MKAPVVLLLIAVCIVGCNKSKIEGSPAAGDTSAAAGSMSAADERAAVEAVIRDFQSAYMAKDWSRMQGLLSSSGELKFFGTDSAEVIRSVADFQKQMSDDWKVIENPTITDMHNLSILLDKDNNLASAIYEVRFGGKVGGEAMNATGRFAQTFRKESGAWKLAQGMVAFATTGQSSAGMVAKMNASASK